MGCSGSVGGALTKTRPGNHSKSCAAGQIFCFHYSMILTYFECNIQSSESMILFLRVHKMEPDNVRAADLQ